MSLNRVLGLATVLVLVAAAARTQIHDPRAIDADPATAETPIAPALEGLGDHHFEVTTSVPASQRFFDQGLRLTYGFNHSEALRAFKEAARLDPENAMAYWGWALVLGPNITLPMAPDVAGQAYDASRRAVDPPREARQREGADQAAVHERGDAERDLDRRAVAADRDERDRRADQEDGPAHAGETSDA